MEVSWLHAEFVLDCFICVVCRKGGGLRYSEKDVNLKNLSGFMCNECRESDYDVPVDGYRSIHKSRI